MGLGYLRCSHAVWRYSSWQLRRAAAQLLPYVDLACMRPPLRSRSSLPLFSPSPHRLQYKPKAGDISMRDQGSLVAHETGQVRARWHRQPKRGAGAGIAVGEVSCACSGWQNQSSWALLHPNAVPPPHR